MSASPSSEIDLLIAPPLRHDTRASAANWLRLVTEAGSTGPTAARVEGKTSDVRNSMPPNAHQTTYSGS